MLFVACNKLKEQQRLLHKTINCPRRILSPLRETSAVLFRRQSFEEDSDSSLYPCCSQQYDIPVETAAESPAEDDNLSPCLSGIFSPLRKKDHQYSSCWRTKLRTKC